MIIYHIFFLKSLILISVGELEPEPVAENFYREPEPVKKYLEPEMEPVKIT